MQRSVVSWSLSDFAGVIAATPSAWPASQRVEEHKHMATAKKAASSTKKASTKKAGTKSSTKKAGAKKSARKYSPAASKSVETEMHEMKRGKLRSGSGQKVTNPKQAIAIGLSEARKAGKKVPAPKKSAAKKSAARKSA